MWSLIGAVGTNQPRDLAYVAQMGTEESATEGHAGGKYQ
jgi:hypothetical protein